MDIAAVLEFTVAVFPTPPPLEPIADGDYGGYTIERVSYL